MQQLRTVVVGTDLTAGAQAATDRAAQLAATAGAQLQLVHVVEPDWLLAVRDLVNENSLQAAVEEQCRIQLAVLAAPIAAKTPLRPEVVLRTGSPVRELAEAAQLAALLVVAAGGGNQLREVTLGSTASRLARVLTAPLLVVRQAPGDAAYRRVLVATDFSDVAERTLRTAFQLAPGADIELVHCHELAYELHLRMAGTGDDQLTDYRGQAHARAQRQAEALLAEVGAPAKVRITLRHGDPRFELLAAAKQSGAELIVVGKQGRSFLADTLLGSVSSWLLREAHCDVLVVPTTARASTRLEEPVRPSAPPASDQRPEVPRINSASPWPGQ